MEVWIYSPVSMRGGVRNSSFAFKATAHLPSDAHNRPIETEKMNLQCSILGVFDLSFTQDRVKWPKMDVYNTFSLTGFILTMGPCRVTATPRFHSILLQLHTLKAQYITVPIKVPRDTLFRNPFPTWIIPAFPTSRPICVSNEGRVELKIVKYIDSDKPVQPPLWHSSLALDALCFCFCSLGQQRDEEFPQYRQGLAISYI